MKIAVMGTIGIPAKYGGVERHVEELYTRLAERGHQITVFCRSFYTETGGLYRGIRLVRLPTIRTKHMENLVHTSLATMVALGHDYHLVHYHAMGPALFSLIPKLRGMRSAVTLHGLDWQRDKWGPLARRVLQLGENAAVRFPDTTVVVSRTMQEYLRRKYRKEARYIPNGVNIPSPASPASPEPLRHLGIESGRYILFASKLSPEKGCHYLIDAFKQVRTDHRLVIAGGSRHSDDYISSLKARAGPEVLFLGFVWGEVLEALFTHAYLFVQPSTIEGLAISVLEAMSYGKCVVCSDIPENREVIADCGITFRDRDEGHLAQKLAMLLSKPGYVEELGNSARERVRREYNWDKVARETEQLFVSLL